MKMTMTNAGWALALTAALTACGGGGGGGGGAGTAGTAATPAAAVQNAITLSGTAATGAAMAGAEVSLRCQGGSGSGTTSATGTFSVTVAGASLPCMLRATSASTTLYGLATGSGQGSATANVTPLTHLIVSTAARRDLAALFAEFGATSLGDNQLATAKAAVAALLAGAGIDIVADAPLSQTFAVGDALDRKLDALQTRLSTGGATLADLAASLRDGAADMAKAQLKAPPIAACPHLRDGNYQSVFSDGASGMLTIDFGTRTASQWISTAAGGRAHGGAITLSGTQACQFSFNGLDGRVYSAAASQQGIFVLRDSTGPVGISFPMQKLAVADLAGAWNTIEYSSTERGFGTLAIGADGSVVARECAANADACTTQTLASRLVPVARANPWAGGAALPDTFAVLAPGSTTMGVVTHAYRSPAGGMFLVSGVPGDGLLFASRQIALALPAVGRVVQSWTAEQTAADVSAFSYGGNRITAVDAATGSVTRANLGDGLSQYRLYNKPRDGMRYRPAQTGSGRNYNALVQLVPVGAGLTVYAGTEGGISLGITVDDR